MRDRWRTLGQGCVVCFMSVAACGGETAGEGRSDGTGGVGSVGDRLALEEVAEVYAPIICDYLVRCGTAAASLDGGPNCVESSRASLEEGSLAAYRAAVAAGTLSYDPELGADCVNSLASLSCTILEESVACDTMFAGQVLAGQACRLDEECADGLYCDLDTTCPGTCRERAPLGGACTSFASCAEGLNCDYTSGTCVTPLAIGAACDAVGSCEAGHFCSDAGTCASVADLYSGNEGEACSLASFALCAPGLHCVMDAGATGATTGHCTSTEFTAGATCRESIPEACASGSYCALPSNGGEGTCVALLAEGGDCSTDDHCDFDTLCAGGICRAPVHLGGACLDPEQCFSGNCAGGVCAPYDPCLD